jgi:hypothetical protein
MSGVGRCIGEFQGLDFVRVEGSSVPRYFFKIQVSDGEFEDDPQGTNLPNTAAALSYAERAINELRSENGFNDPGLMVIVEDDARRTVLSLPFLPGCA